MAIERGTASKICIKDVVDGKFIKAEQRFEPNLIVTPLNEKISRVRVMGTVVSRFVSEDGKYASLTLDDASDTITVRAFRDDIELLRDIKPGDIVDVVGKIKEYNEEKYIAPESIRKIEDPNWELVRKLELLLKESRLEERKVGAVETEAKVAEQPASTPAEEVVEETVSEDPKLVTLNLIEKMDEGEGVKYVTLLSESGLEEEKLESVLNELMGDGEVYEPKIGRFKRV
ncbi:MAG: OB-fold nucleic acid binding domain-containing protein [Methanobacteriota archaeon]